MSDSSEPESPIDLQKPLSSRKIAQIVKQAAKDAAETKDYISYATVLEEYLDFEDDNPPDFTDDDKGIIFSALLDVVSENDELVYTIGWDIPMVLMKLVEGDYDFGESITSSRHIKLSMKILNVICEKGNPKELFLKGVEALAQLRMAKTAKGRPENVRQQYFNIKFYMAYELMFYSLRTVDTQYPSRFLATAITSLLSFFTTNLNDLSPLSLSVILRRLFAFARDFEPRPNPTKEVTEYEMSLLRNLIQCLPSWISEICFQICEIQWSKRLYYELKAGVAMAEFNVRKSSISFKMEERASRINECLERLSQLTFAFDLNVLQELKDLANKPIATSDLDSEQQQDDEAKTNNNDDDNKWSDSNMRLSSQSEEGILLLATQLRFDYRLSAEPELTFKEVVALTNRFASVSNGEISLGSSDALCFWGLWSTKSISEEEVQQIGKTNFATYIQQIMMLSASSPDKDFRYLAFSLAAKLLGLHDPEISFDIITDTIEYCPFENIQDATIRILKGLCMSKQTMGTPSTGHKNESMEKLTTQVKQLNIDNKSRARIDLVNERREKIQELVLATTEDVFEVGYSSEKLPILLGWLNFLNIIETDKLFLQAFVDRVTQLIKVSNQLLDSSNSEFTETSKMDGILELAIEGVSKKWL